MAALTLDALLRSFKKGAFDPVYLLQGDEDVLKDEAVRALLAAAVDPSTRDFNLDVERLTFRDRLWPTWRILETVIHHDSYHAGQIPVLRYGVSESSVPPPSSAEDIRRCCADLPSW